MEKLSREILDFSVSKILSLTISICLTTFVIPMLTLVIRYEQNQHHRTLMNQLVSKLIWYDLFFLLFCQIPFIILYSFGHLPENLCHTVTVLVPSTVTGFLWIVDSLSVIRYLFVFHMKNPTANQDDFWSKFLFLWTFSSSLIFNIAFYILPGKNGHFYYICTGQIPSNLLHAPTKWNFLIVFKAYSSTIISILVFFKCKTFKANEISNQSLQESMRFVKRNLPSVTFCIGVMLVMMIQMNIMARNNKTDIESSIKYPAYMWLHFTNLCCVPIANFIYLTILLTKDKNLRTFVYRECEVFVLEKICQKWSCNPSIR